MQRVMIHGAAHSKQTIKAEPQNKGTTRSQKTKQLKLELTYKKNNHKTTDKLGSRLEDNHRY